MTAISVRTAASTTSQVRFGPVTVLVSATIVSSEAESAAVAVVKEDSDGLSDSIRPLSIIAPVVVVPLSLPEDCPLVTLESLTVILSLVTNELLINVLSLMFDTSAVFSTADTEVDVVVTALSVPVMLKFCAIAPTEESVSESEPLKVLLIAVEVVTVPESVPVRTPGCMSDAESATDPESVATRPSAASAASEDAPESVAANPFVIGPLSLIAPLSAPAAVADITDPMPAVPPSEPLPPPAVNALSVTDALSTPA
jgi:hypothetical protein